MHRGKAPIQWSSGYVRQNLGTSSFNMEMPPSPKMNPNFAAFSPNYAIPGKLIIHVVNR
jgi:hypothetical protein